MKYTAMSILPFEVFIKILEGRLNFDPAYEKEIKSQFEDTASLEESIQRSYIFYRAPDKIFGD